MKKAYTQPILSCEIFSSTEAVAASVCGKVNGDYVFTCDAPKGVVYYYDKDDVAHQKPKLAGGYSPCKERHTTSNPDDFYDGFVDYNENEKEDLGESNLIWLERFYGYVYNWHASASLKRDMIEVERS